MIVHHVSTADGLEYYNYSCDAIGIYVTPRNFVDGPEVHLYTIVHCIIHCRNRHRMMAGWAEETGYGSKSDCELPIHNADTPA